MYPTINIGQINNSGIPKNPSLIQGIQFRYNFLKQGNYTLSGGVIESMEDVSGNNAGQAVKKSDIDRAAFVASGRVGKPCAFFDRSTAPMIAPSIVGGTYTKICVFNAKELVNGDGSSNYFGGSTGHLISLNPLNSLGWVFSDVFKSLSYNAASPKNADSDIIIMIATHEVNDSRLYVGNQLYDQNLTNPVNSDSSAYLGGYNNMATFGAKGEVYEWLLYDRVLTQAEINDVVEYMIITYNRNTSYNYIACGIGQSNCVGTASGVSPTHAGQSKEINPSSIIIRDINDPVGKERNIVSINREANISSLFPQLANQLNINQSKNILFCQTAVGGSSAGAKGGSLHWGDSGSSQPIRNQALSTIISLKTWYKRNIDFIIDIQGESDSGIDGTTYLESEYVAYKQDLYDAIWKISPTTKILVAKIAYRRDASDIAQDVYAKNAVNSAYDTLAINNSDKVYVVHDASGYTKTSLDIESDGIHWTLQGLNACANSIETWIGLNM